MARSLLSLIVAGLLGSVPVDAADFDPHEVFTVVCSSCHTVGGGDRIGPDLAGVTGRRSREWLVRFIRSPRGLLDAKDPVATGLSRRFDGRVMPDQPLAPGEVERLLEYLEAGGPSAWAVRAAKPDRRRIGRLLFYGARPFDNGAAACSACHSLSGAAAIGSLGGDLQEVASRYPGIDLANQLRRPETPFMRELYAERPLTPEEAAAVARFVAGAGAADDPPAIELAVASVPWIGLVTGILFGLFGDLVLSARRLRAAEARAS